MWELLLGIALVGILDGVIAGTMGASGCMLIVPVLSLVGVEIKAAFGTSLLVDTIGSSVVAYTYHQHKNVNVKQIGLWLTIGQVIGAQVGCAFAEMIPSLSLEAAYSIFLIIIGVYMWRRERKTKSSVSHKGVKISSPTLLAVFSALIGLALGPISVLFGGGGGGITLMVLLFVFGFPIHKAVGTSAMVQVAHALSGAVGYATRGHIDIFYGLIVIIGVVIGGRLAAKYANKIKEEKFSKLAGTIFVILGVIMIFLR